MPPFKIIVGTLFGLLIVGVSILGIVSYRYNEQVVQTSYWINHTHEVIQFADEISSAFRDLQLEGNAIYIVGDTSRMQQYRIARHLVSSQLASLRNLTEADQYQRPSIDSLSELLGKVALFADPVLPLGQLNTMKDVQHRIYNSNELRDRISGALSTIIGRETNLLRGSEKENSRSIASFNKAFSELLAGMAVLVVVAFFSIRYNFNRLLRIDEQLRTAQERTEKALANEIETNKLKSNFVALASHEFRTPLTTVLSSAALIENYSFGENQAKVNKHLARIRSSVSSLTSILNEFLSLEKIEMGKMTPNVERFDMKQYLEGCVSNMRNFAKEGQMISYTHTGPSDVETDPVFMGNIINNLVTNAIKYSPPNSRISISSHVNEKIHLTVKDNGIGIPEQDQRHLFERFYRASNAGTVQGTGLGLHIMRHYVDMLHGTVKLNSEVGKGTTVLVTLDRSARY